MDRPLSAAFDRRLEAFLLVRARGRWPVLTLVPALVLRPALAPHKQRLRRSLTLAAVATSAMSALLAGLLT